MKMRGETYTIEVVDGGARSEVHNEPSGVVLVALVREKASELDNLICRFANHVIVLQAVPKV